MRLGIVGNGYIARFHAEAFEALGTKFMWLIHRDESTEVEPFKEAHGIAFSVGATQFLRGNNDRALDGLVIACTTENAADYIEWCRLNNVWALIEKPVSFDVPTIKKFENYRKSMVAFNRRYYPNISFLREKIKTNPESKIFVDLDLPQGLSSSGDFGGVYKQIFANCVHGIDLLAFLCGQFKVVNVDKIMSNGSRVVRAMSGNIDIRINFLLDTPTNFALRVHGLDESFTACPLEILYSSNRLKYIPPSSDYPVARYVPEILTTISAVNMEYQHLKPGFYEQANTFLRFIGSDGHVVVPGISDALFAQDFLQNIFEDLL